MRELLWAESKDTQKVVEKVGQSASAEVVPWERKQVAQMDLPSVESWDGLSGGIMVGEMENVWVAL